MKTTKALLLLSLLALCLPLRAQTVTNPPPNATTLPGQVLGYFTSFNTNFDTTFGDNRFDLWAGAVSVQNVGHPLLNAIGGSYDLWRPAKGTNGGSQIALSLELDTRNEGLAGNLISAQGGVGLSAIFHDVKTTLYLDGGKYVPTDFDPWFGELGLRVKKAIGQHFYMGVQAALQYRDIKPAQLTGTDKWGQVYAALVGVTF